MRITPMTGAFGAIVTGVDVGRLGASDECALVEALFIHGVVVVAEQHLDESSYSGFGHRFGNPVRFFSEKERHRDHPELIRITNSPRTPTGLRDGAMHWHSDSSYEAIPASVTMLYALEAPTTGNDTLFADTSAAFEALDDETRRRVANLRVIHDPRGGRVHLDGEVRGDSSSTSLPRVTHPLVMTHPITGRRGLFGISGSAWGIEGMVDDDALDLLRSLKRFVLQAKFRQRARAEANSVLIWDNFRVIHSATPTVYSDADGQRRRLLRISTTGLPPSIQPAGTDVHISTST